MSAWSVKFRRFWPRTGFIANSRGGQLDISMLLAVVTLLVVGTLLVFSTTLKPGIVAAGGDPYFNLKRHLIFMGIGIGAFVVVLNISDSVLNAIAHSLLLISIILLGAIYLVPNLGVTGGNSTRWLALGPFTFQPSELAKLGFVLYLAKSLAHNQAVVHRFVYGLGPALVAFGLLTVLLLRQPDVGSVMVLGILMILMFLVAGTGRWNLWAILVGGAIGFLIMVVAWPAKFQRVFTPLYLDQVSHGEGYQLTHAITSLVLGGTFGQGLGQGAHHSLGFLPASHNDFIMAVAGEELGLFGVACLMILYAVILIRGVATARLVQGVFAKYAVFGLTMLLVLPAIVHLGVNLGLLPTKGLVCPFMSYGGTAQVVNLVTFGLIQRFHIEATAEDAQVAFAAQPPKTVEPSTDEGGRIAAAWRSA